MIRCLSESIFKNKVTISEVKERQTNLLKNVLEFYDRIKPKSKRVYYRFFQPCTLAIFFLGFCILR